MRTGSTPVTRTKGKYVPNTLSIKIAKLVLYESKKC